MKLSTLSAGLAGLAALAGSLAVSHQHARLVALRSECERLETTRAALRAVPSAPPAPSSAGPSLSETDKLELLRLRAEATRLRARQHELEPVRAENEALREQVRGNRPPPGYLRMQELRFSGQTTPEATLQSFIWAIGQGDTNTLCQLLTDEDAAQFMNDPEGRQQKELRAAAHMLPGFRLVEIKQRSPTEAALTVELLPGEPAQEIIVRLQGGRWRMTL